MSYEDSSTWRLSTVGGIPYKLVSMNGSFEVENGSVSLTVLVPSSRLLSFAEEVLPIPSLVGGFPSYESLGVITGTNLRAQRITWKGHTAAKPVDPFGFDGGGSSGTYQPVCEAVIEYASKQEEDENDPETFLEVSCNTAGEFIYSSAPKGKWEDPGGGGDEEKNKLQALPINILVPESEWNVRWPKVPSKFWKETLVSRLRAALGKVNSNAMPLLFNAPAETILFAGYSLERSYSWRVTEPATFSLNMKFLEKHIEDGNNVIGHNEAWKADEGWKRILFDGVNPLYQSVDLNDLFKP